MGLIQRAEATNALDEKMALAVGYTTSGAEELQKKLPEARVVKTFNMVFAQHMDSGRLVDNQLTAFVAGDDAAAKSTAIELASKIGFDAVDAGPLANARLLDPLGLSQHPTWLRARFGHADRLQALALARPGKNRVAPDSRPKQNIQLGWLVVPWPKTRSSSRTFVLTRSCREPLVPQAA